MKKLLVVVDFQHDFVAGTLGFPEAAALDPIIARKIRQYRQDGAAVIFTLDTHHDDYLETNEGRGLPVAHCVRGTPGWELYGEVGQSVAPDDLRLEKPTFGSLELADYLQDGRFTHVELGGLVTNICVLSNAIIAKTALPEAQISVDATAVASYDERLHRAALDILQGLQVQVINR